MGILDSLGSILNSSGQGGGLGGLAGGLGGLAGGLGGLAGGLSSLGPAAIGGLLGALMPKGGGGLLKVGGAAALATLLWDRYKDKISPPAQTAGRAPGAFPAEPAAGFELKKSLDPRAARMIRAMVYAAKSDGRLDEQERAAIEGKLREMEAGPEAEALVRQTLNEPVDPSLAAREVSGPEEALELYLASCAVIKPDTFLENAYMDALAQALGVPAEVKRDIAAEAFKP